MDQEFGTVGVTTEKEVVGEVSIKSVESTHQLHTNSHTRAHPHTCSNGLILKVLLTGVLSQ